MMQNMVAASSRAPRSVQALGRVHAHRAATGLGAPRFSSFASRVQKAQSAGTRSRKAAVGPSDSQSRPLTMAASVVVRPPMQTGAQLWAHPEMPAFGAAKLSPDAFVVSPIVDIDSIPASPPPATEVDEAAMEAWATGPMVLGHAHSRPATETYAMSPMEQLGGGMLAPDNWSLTMQSSLGLKSTMGENQDAFSYTLLQSGWVLSVVCDGHGQKGEVVSERVARTIPFFLSQHLCDLGFEKALPEAFELAQKDLERNFSPCRPSAARQSRSVASTPRQERPGWLMPATRPS